MVLVGYSWLVSIDKKIMTSYDITILAYETSMSLH